MKIYLASKSPRRRELLLQMGVAFEILEMNVSEEIVSHETAEMYSKRITGEKLTAAWDKIIKEKLVMMPVLCADTEVVLDQRILGKPDDYQAAFAMLKNYSGLSHQVITSTGIQYGDFKKISTNITTVHFATMSDLQIHEYLSMNDYQDKAGSYGIQSFIGQYISKIEGCFYSVIGLPLNTVRQLLVDVQEHIGSQKKPV